MYNSQTTYLRIKELSKIRKIPIGEINEKAGISENTISMSAKRQEGMGGRNLYEIANCLDCSVDYLLGRTDNPDAHKSTIITTGNVTSSIVGNNNHDFIIDNAAERMEIKSTSTIALVKAFEKLDPFKQAKVLCLLDELQK